MILFAVKKPVSVLALATYLFSFAGTASADPGMVVPRELSDEQVLSVVQAEPQPKTSPEDASGKLESIHSLFLDPSAISRSTPADDESHAYEPERYAFEDAVELLRPEYSSAVILEDLSPRDMERLQKLDFEVGIIVLHGEIVLFTTGDEQEIGMLQATQKLLDQADFISHTHVGGYTQDGPSTFDLNHAVAAPQMEYVVTQNGAYAYNSGGLANDGQPYDLNDYLVRLYRAKHASEIKDQVKARAALNEFIYLTDLYNEAQEEERELFRAGSTPLLDSISVTINGGATHTNDPNVTFNFTVGLPIPEGESLTLALSLVQGQGFENIQPFQTSKTATLLGSDGKRTVLMQIKDKAGNSRVLGAPITLDREAPRAYETYERGNIDFEEVANNHSNFGSSIERIGNYILVGDDSRVVNNVPLVGAVDMFDLTGNLIHTFLPSSTSRKKFGSDVKVFKEKYLMIGASGEVFADATDSAYLFNADIQSGSFGQVVHEFLNPEGTSRDGFGRVIEIRDDLAFVAAPSKSIGSNDSAGKVYVFNINPQSRDFGKHLVTLQAPDPNVVRDFGISMAVFRAGASRLIVGSSNGAYMFNVNPGSADFGKMVKQLPTPPGSNHFGSAIDVFEDVIIVGDSLGSQGDGASGVVYLIDGDLSSNNFSE
nr:hypothetical protein [Candidatus Omnitrophota bacterium]